MLKWLKIGQDDVALFNEGAGASARGTGSAKSSRVRLLGAHIGQLDAQLGGGLGVENGNGRHRGMLNAEADQNAREQTQSNASIGPGCRRCGGSRHQRRNTCGVVRPHTTTTSVLGPCQTALNFRDQVPRNVDGNAAALHIPYGTQPA